MFKLGHHLADRAEQRSQDKVNKTGLALRDLRCLPVAQERDGQVLLLLDISLVEELVEEEMSPLNCDFKWPCLCRYISCMHREL